MNNNFASLEYKIDEGNKILEKRLEEKLTKKIEASEQRLEKKLSKKIDDTQTETMETLLDAIHEGYNLHETRMQRVEDKLDLPSLKQKH